MANAPAYDAAAARADKLLKPDGSVQTASGTIVLPADPTRAQAYTQAGWRADKLLEPDGSIVTSGSGSSGATPPGGTTGQVQYNNAGVFAGATSVTTNGTNLSVLGATGNGVILNPTAAGTAPNITTSGTDTNVGLNIKTQGIGAVVIQPTTALANNNILQINRSTGVTAAYISVNEAGSSAQFNLGGAAFSGAGAGFTFTASINTTGGAPVVFAPQTGSTIALAITNTAASPTANYFQVTTNGQPAGDILKIDSSGNTYIRTLKTQVYTVATLPAASAALQGARALVTDATAPTFLGTLTGGGSVICPVFCNGTAWIAG